MYIFYKDDSVPKHNSLKGREVELKLHKSLTPALCNDKSLASRSGHLTSVF